MKHRYYHVGLKRFLSSDPLSVRGLLARQKMANLYAYAAGNPLFWLDILGLCTSSSGWTLSNPNSNLRLSPQQLNAIGQTVSDVNDDFEPIQLTVLGLITGGAAGGPAAIEWVVTHPLESYLIGDAFYGAVSDTLPETPAQAVGTGIREILEQITSP